jgi:hypothetical protein
MGIGCPLPLLLMTPLEAEAVALAKGLFPFTGPIRPFKFGDRNAALPRIPISVTFIGPGHPSGKRLSGIAIETGFRSVCLVGYAAGLSPGYESGVARILSRIVLDDGGSLSPKGADSWSGWLGLETATGVTVGRIVSDPAEKTLLHERTRADMADMESYPWIFEFMGANVEAAVVRVVSDGPDVFLPSAVSGFVNEDGSQNLWRGVFGLVRRPGMLAKFVKALPALLNAQSSLTDLGRRFGRMVTSSTDSR